MRTSKIYNLLVSSLAMLLAAGSACAGVVNLDWNTAVFPTGGSNINYAVGTVNFNIAHTGAIPADRPIEAGTYNGSGGFGTGNSILYGGNAGVPVTVDLTFAEPVNTLQLSLYDIDNSDSVTLSAFNGATDISPTIVLATESVSPTYTLAGNVATGTGSNSGGGSTNGTLNVTVAGPITRLRVVGLTPTTQTFLFAVSDITVTTPDPPPVMCSAPLIRLDWDNQTYTAGALSPSFSVADVPFPDVVFTFAHGGNFADLGPSSPDENNGFTNTGSIGGGGSMINYFHDPDPNSDSQLLTIEISFSDTLQDVRFSLADIDSFVDVLDFADQVTIVGVLPGSGTVSPIFESVSDGATYGFSGNSVNSHLGFDDSTDDDPRSAVNIYFDQAIVGIRLDYDDLAPNTFDSSRAILLSDIVFCPPSSVPVTLSYFSSRNADGAVQAIWQTASQSMHAGFELQLLGAHQKSVASRTVPSNRQWSTDVENYAVELDGVGESLLLVSHDIDGKTQEFGPFALGSDNGTAMKPNPINWSAISQELDASLQLKGLRHQSGKSLTHQRKGAGQSAWLDVSEVGLHRVTFAQLQHAGLNFQGAASSDIALTLRNEPIPRRVNISNPGAGFGVGDSIDFIGQAPSAEDGLYLNSNRYRLDIKSSMARPARLVSGFGQGPAPDSYLHRERVAENNEYQPATPTLDPWFDQELSTFGAGFSDVSLPVSNLASGSAQVTLDLVGLTDFTTSPNPDHHLQASLNGGSVFIDARTDGLREWVLNGNVPSGDLVDGLNTLRLTLPGDTGFPFDIVNLEAYSLSYPRAFVALNDQLMFEATAGRFELMGFSSDQLVAYAKDEGGEMLVLPLRSTSSGGVSLGGAGGGSEALFASGFEDSQPGDTSPQAVAASYFVSTIAALSSPAVSPAGSAPVTSVASQTTYLIIAHPAFIGPDLDTYVAARNADGYTVQVVNVADLYDQFSFGMALPSAITDFVREAMSQAPIGHVLLVGADTFDYRNFSGQGSVSFIPTAYASTNKFVNFTPSDGLLVDVDGDEVADLPVGRWPVRTTAELTTLVNKTLDFERSGLSARQKVALVAGMSDPTIPPFFQQAERIGDRLVDAGGVPWSSRQEVFVDELGVGPAQSALIAAINDGQTMTIYSGHGAADLWAFEGLLTPAMANSLTNAGEPTLMMPLTCYTTYFVDPSSDTLAYSLLSGGDRGAVAVHGAATLSIFGDNEALGVRVVDDMLLNGFTLGQAINAAKKDLSVDNFSRYRPVIINWALLGDPTLRVTP
ncbi:MAG: C25 family cysteine peptidase [Lysobacterales bacterium]